jgi:hypothetical protein
MMEFGHTFVTRGRAAKLVKRAQSGEELAVDFDGVAVLSPSFADEFVGRLAERVETVQLDGLSEQLGSLMERTILRRRLAERMKVRPLA